MFGFDSSGFNLAIVAVLFVFMALLLFVIGQTVLGLLRDRKSGEIGKVDGDVARKGVGNGSSGSHINPSVEAERDGPKTLKSYSDEDFEDIEWNMD